MRRKKFSTWVTIFNWFESKLNHYLQPSMGWEKNQSLMVNFDALVLDV